tara:strand:- start:4075 stop:4392 length:318 start_codon:yes stop_codon:yes gene_type:complete
MTKAGDLSVGEMRVDGGAAVVDLLLQLQANQIGSRVSRPTITETTAQGAAMIAGLAEGVWNDKDEIADAWRLDEAFDPQEDRSESLMLHEQWLRAVERSKNWAID